MITTKPILIRFLVTSIALATTVALAPGCAGKVSPIDKDLVKKEIVPLIGNFKVQRYRFDNGLKLLVVEDHSSPTLAYQTWYNVGSRNEEPGRTGLAHLFEHMMFKETKNLKDGEFDKILEEAGAEGENAFTSRDYTAYVQEMPKKELELIARLEAERMRNLIINDKAFKTERDVVQNERRYRNENNPDGLMYQELFGLAFMQHPYHWPVIGYQEDLDRMSSDNAVKFYNNHYSPANATVIVSGDIEPETVKTVIDKYYKSLPGQKAIDTPVPPEPEQLSPRRKILKLNMQVEKLLIGFHVPEVTHADKAAIDVADVILTGGKSSRLSRALVETGIASSADSYGLDDKDPSLWIATVNLQKGKKAAQAESVILKEIAKLALTPLPAQELQRAKNRLNFYFYETLNSNNGKAYFLGKYETLTGGFETGIEEFKKTQEITAADVQAVAKRYLVAKRRSVVTGVPK